LFLPPPIREGKKRGRELCIGIAFFRRDGNKVKKRGER